MRRRVGIAVFLVGLAGPGAAQELPDYFIDEIVAANWATQLATFCPSLTVNPVTAAQRSNDVLSRLSEDGIDLETMPDGVAVEEIEAKSAEISERYGLANPTTEAICEAGAQEIAAETILGRYLLLVED